MDLKCYLILQNLSISQTSSTLNVSFHSEIPGSFHGKTHPLIKWPEKEVMTDSQVRCNDRKVKIKIQKAIVFNEFVCVELSDFLQF